MSATDNPITPARFASALESLPIDALHAKAAEIQNSMGHLRSSNEQMMPFADEGDQDCKEAMFENLSVIGRMNERIALIRAEVERRGLPWSEVEDEHAALREGKRGGDGMVNGDGAVVNGVGDGEVNGARLPSGSLTDDELRRQLEARLAEGSDEENEDGVHL